MTGSSPEFVGDQERLMPQIAVQQVRLGSRLGLVVTLTGALDAGAARKLDDMLATLVVVDRPPHLIVDAGRLGTCDEAVLIALVRAHRAIRASGGRLALAGVHGMLARRLRRTGLDTIFELFPNVPVAESALAG
ncbi:STAS domain-containing protein [Nonomuraea ceibae]|uniref:STAS domain-containing protein n=1 Tax=Nonomuraea ceibae TaxID=1935170 RepID=UPI001C5FA393|nr:STAS domain-containing protein [Nonomuraea ceibae]